MSNKELIYKAREWVRSGHARGESGYLIGTLADALKAAQQRITELEAERDEATKDRDEFLEQRNEYIGFEHQAQAALDAIRAEEVILRPVLGERSRLRVILDSVPADRLNTVKAEAIEAVRNALIESAPQARDQ